LRGSGLQAATWGEQIEAGLLCGCVFIEFCELAEGDGKASIFVFAEGVESE
jgi:hypothetical protein